MASNYSIKNTFIYPSGTTAARPTSVSNGSLYFNTTVGALQIYQNGSWYVLTNINAPGTPTSAAATDQGTGRAYNNGQASISFTPATETVGFPASYTVTSTPGSYTGTGTSSPITVTGLQSNTSYTYTVTSTNNTGTSSASSASSAVTATTVPQAPTIGTATGGDSSATLTFTAGATGGSAITNYKYSTDNTTYTAFSPAQTSSPLSFSGLTNGTSYAFYLKAVNANGDSSASSISNSITPAAATAFDSIQTVYVSSGTQSTINFTSIPQTYKHLQIRWYARTDRNVNDGDYMLLRFNGISTANSYYGQHYVRGNGSVAYAAADGTYSGGFIERMPALNTLSSVFGSGVIDVLDYTDTNKNKVWRHLGGYDANGDANANVRIASGMLLSAPAISSITITSGTSSNFITGSHFALYGIRGS